MTDSNLSPQAKAERSIARQEAAMTRVDSQGRPLGPPAVFTYDEQGHLVSAVPGKANPDPDDAA